MRRRKILFSLLAAMMPMVGWCADGDTFKVNSAEGKEMLFTVISEDEKTCKITGITDKISATGSLAIPSEANGYRVTTIARGAFSGARYLEEITLPDGLTSIESEAFGICNALKEMVIPETVTHFGWSVFNGCSSLKSVNILPTWTRIPEYSFIGCSSLEGIEIPNSITSIGEAAFRGCKSLKYLFLPANVTKMEADVFAGCSGLESIVVEDGNPTYDSRDNCNALIETAKASLLYGCKNTVIPSGIKSIGEYAFYQNESITSISIPSGVQAIVTYAFQECTNLKEIEIPATMIQIYKKAFSGCTSLTSVKCYNKTPPSLQAANVFENINSDATLYVRPGCKDTYAQMVGWNVFKNIVEMDDAAEWYDGDYFTATIANGVQVTAVVQDALSKTCWLQGNYDSPAIPSSYTGSLNIPSEVNGFTVVGLGQCTLCNCPGVTSVNIPGTVTNIENYSIYYCSSLTAINISASVKSIGSSAIGYLPALTSLTIEPGNPVYDSRDNCNAIIETATNRLIKGCSATTIPLTVNSIGSDAFNGASADKFTVPSNVVNIDDYAFRLSQFSHITLAEGVKEIRDYVFLGSSIKSIDLPTSLTKIGRCAFENCSQLQSITIPEGITSIEQETFNGCRALKDVTIPGSVTSIGSGAFDGCIALEEITIPEGITSIEQETFNGCRALKDVTIPGSVTSIGSGAFGRCIALEEITIPSSVTSIGSGAFAGCNSLKKVIVPDIASWCNISFTDHDSSPLYYAHHLYSDTGTEITDLVIPDGVTAIANYAFCECSGLKSVIFSNDVKTIGYSAFNNCSGLTEVSLPQNLVSLGVAAFADCQELTSIVLPHGLEVIEWEAFSRCTSLASVVIPSTVTTIGFWAFASCSSLNAVTSLITNPFDMDMRDDVFYYYNGNASATLYVPSGCTEAYRNTTGWKNFATIVESDMTFKLIYLVDGKEYKTCEIQATEAVTPEPYPYKEGYVFSGWSGIPSVMPAHDVTVTGSFEIIPSGIEEFAAEKATPKACYSIDGRHESSMQRGLNIIRMSDGTTRKVIVK